MITRKMIAVIRFILLINVISANAAEPKNLKLELIQTLFRHGDRYPTKSQIEAVGPDFFNKQFKNEDLEQLTKKGMMRAYKLGQMLRKRYDDILGEFEYNDVVARSTNMTRTKMSLQLVLAGLYPPTEKTDWSDEIEWSPIPTDYEPLDIDFLFISFFGPCTRNGALLAEAEKASVKSGKMAKYKAVEKKLADHTNIKVLTPISGFGYRGYLSDMESLDYPPPEYLNEEDINNLTELVGLFYKELMNTEEGRRSLVGPTVEQMLKNIKENQENKRKIVLYSAHDTNLGFFLNAHNFTGIPPTIEFGSAVLVEQLRDSDNNVYIRMFYWAGVSEKMIPLKLKNCGYLCLLSKYTEIVKPMIPNEEQKYCYSLKRYCDKNT